MKKRSLEEILGQRIHDEYLSQYAFVMGLVEQGKIVPVKSAPKNGRKPALYTAYHIVEEKPDYSELLDELRLQIHPMIAIDFYLKHPDIYEEERESVLLLSDYLKDHSGMPEPLISVNERCFAIWGKEKYLSSGGGKTILKHCGLAENFLKCYPTAEPFAYYARTRDVPQNILILENKDPFFSMRKHLLSGHTSILGIPIGTLIYGAGKRVVSSFQEFSISSEPYMQDKRNTLLYFGDLDYEGIGIYEKLAETFNEFGNIIPWNTAYCAMMEKGSDFSRLPMTKEQQNRHIGHKFFDYFETSDVQNMQSILQRDRYIPQEILNITDF